MVFAVDGAEASVPWREIIPPATSSPDPSATRSAVDSDAAAGALVDAMPADSVCVMGGDSVVSRFGP